MADKKGKQSSPMDKKKTQTGKEKKNDENEEGKNISQAYVEHVKNSLINFNKLSEEERINLYGDKEFLEQFWDHFKEEHPTLLDKISQEDLPLYLKALEKKGFTLKTMIEDADQLHEDFHEQDTELHVMESSLKRFGDVCRDNANGIPLDKYKEFAENMGFDAETGNINPDTTKFKTLDDLRNLRENFAEKEKIQLKDGQKKKIKAILMPDYNPTERIMVKIAINKIKKELKGKLREDFDATFGGEITAFSRIQNLTAFRNAWINFLHLHAGEIDEDLAKKLDAIGVKNQDIKNELLQSGKNIDTKISFLEEERKFKIIFDKLASRQLFKEIQDTQKTIDHYVDVIIDGMRAFPPYVNEIFNIYPHNEKSLQEADPSMPQKLMIIDQKIAEKENKIIDGSSTQEEKLQLRKEIAELKEQRAKVRWQAYIKSLETKDSQLAKVMQTLIDSNFTFSQLHTGQQQTLIDTLVKYKLEDIIKKKAPELLSTDEEELHTFIHDLFDLQKMDVGIPTYQGTINIKFTKKEFAAQEMKKLLSMEELGRLENLPLHFEVVMTPSSEDFFEKSIIFHSMFDEFKAKNKTQSINDSYKVRITKNGQTVEGYLSHYSPIGSRNISKVEKAGGNIGDPDVRYLYSLPITSPSDERELITRDHTEEGTPVFMKTSEEGQYHLEVTEKKINLNSEGIGALMSGFVLGQQSFYRTMDASEEKALKQKFDKLKTYQDIHQDKQDENAQDNERKETEKTEKTGKIEKTEKTKQQKFLEAWNQLEGYKFGNQEKNGGFAVGARILIKAGDTAYPPLEFGGDAWMRLEIININENKGTFTVKIHGGECPLDKLEGSKKELKMDASSLDNIKTALSDSNQIYKFPPVKKGFDRDRIIGNIKSSGNSFAGIFKDNLDNLHRDDSKKSFTFANGDFAGKDVEYFGYDEVDYSSSKIGKTETQVKPVYYKTIFNTNGTVTVKNATPFVDEKSGEEFKYEQTMDPVMFALFAASKKLQPKPHKQEMEKNKVGVTKEEGRTQRKPWFSVKNMLGFFSSGAEKIKNGIKKYDEEKVEDLTEIMLDHGKVFEKLGAGLGTVFQRVGYGMERAGMEYYIERDNRVRKKIERRQKIYEGDPHFSSFAKFELKKMCNSSYRPKDMYKIPAMLLAFINKEKSPYSRNPEMVGKGMRVNMILGQKHQQRFLDKMNKYQAELKQNSSLYGPDWTVHMNEEIVKMEMKYIVGVIDGREDIVSREHEKRQASKRSRTFANKLDEAMEGKFGFKSIESKHKEIAKTTRFEVAEYEYNRHIYTNRIASAMPYLKTMAEQAQTPKQFSILQMHVMGAMMSGRRRNQTDGNTKGRIKDITRTAGILPGLFAKDPMQQSKVFRLIQIYSNNKFGSTPCDLKGGLFKFGGKSFESLIQSCTSSTMENVGEFIKQFKDRRINKENGKNLMKFLSFDASGKDITGKKTLVEIANDPNTSNEDKALLKEYISFGEEGSQDIDLDVRHNFMAMLTHPFTKSQTIVRELMKFEGGEFSGRDSHDKGGSEEFRKSVARELPQKGTSKTNVIYYVRKFLNWFGNLGFEGSDRTIFVKRLKTISQMYTDAQKLPESQRRDKLQEADDTLMYTINGTILSGGPGKGNPPDAFETGLNAFKDFFKANLHTILEPDIISATMGTVYMEDSKKPYKVGDRAEYVGLNDQASLMEVSGEERKERVNLRQKLRSSTYIHDELYRLAEGLNRSHGMENIFKKYYDPDDVAKQRAAKKNQTKEQLQNTLGKQGIKIKNKTSLQKLENLLSGRPEDIGSTEDDELAAMGEEAQYLR